MMILIYVSTLKWTLIASAFAVPLSLLYLGRWLNDYAVRIQPHWWIFACSFLVVLVFQTLITLGQTQQNSPQESGGGPEVRIAAATSFLILIIPR